MIRHEHVTISYLLRVVDSEIVITEFLLTQIESQRFGLQ